MNNCDHQLIEIERHCIRGPINYFESYFVGWSWSVPNYNRDYEIELKILRCDKCNFTKLSLEERKENGPNEINTETT